MSIWLWFVLGLIPGTAPSLLTEARFRPWWARRWWWLSFGLVFTLFILPFGIVLIMLLSASAFDAIEGMGKLLWHDELRPVTGLTLGWLTASGVMAWLHRHAPRLQGPPPSEQVMALARDAENQWKAIQLYRQETGMALPIATDVVEGYVASQRDQPQPPAPDGRQGQPLDSMYGGFATAWYVVLASIFVLTLPSQTNYFLTGLALFVFMPSLFGGGCGLCARVTSAQTKAAFQMALQSGTLTRRYAFIAGVAAGIMSMAGVLAIGWIACSLDFSEVGVLIALLSVAGVLALSPFLGLWLLNKRAARYHQN
jgi:hypothetical protein